MTIEEIINAKRIAISELFKELPLPIIDEAQFIDSVDVDTLKIPLVPSLDTSKIKGESSFTQSQTIINYTIYLDGNGKIFKESMDYLEKDRSVLTCRIDEDKNYIRLTFKMERYSGLNIDDHVRKLFKSWVEQTNNSVAERNAKAVAHNASLKKPISEVYKSEVSKASYFKQNYNPF